MVRVIARVSSTLLNSNMPNPAVLIVDDVAATRTGLAELLRLKGYEPLEAASAEEALRVLNARPETKLVVLDLQMPGAGGIWFRQEQLRSENIAQIPVVVFTGGELPPDSLGFCARLNKP